MPKQELSKIWEQQSILLLVKHPKPVEKMKPFIADRSLEKQ